jgi:hypothetical protein
MFGATTETEDVVFIIGFAAGGVLIATVVGLWIRSRMKKK